MALARRMVELGVDPTDLVLFEAGSEAGGLCRSKTVEGFTYDRAGGHILYSKDPAVMDWMKHCAGGEDAFDRRERHTKIRFGDRWVRYPFENGLGDLEPTENFECVKGYVDAWHRRRTDTPDVPTDFAAWIRWRFGDGIAQHFMDPYNQKIWKRPLQEIASDWVAGRVPDAPLDDVLKSSIGIRTQGYTPQAIFFYPKSGGFQAITDGMASTLKERIRLSTRVAHVVRAGEGWSVDGEAFDRVVTTIPLNDLPDVVEGVPDGIADAMRGLSFNGLVCFLVALDRPEHPNLSWIYLPHASQGPANRVTYMSNYATDNAPEGKTSFLCEVTLDGRKPAPGPELEEEVLAGLTHAGILKREEVLFTDRADTRHAYIVYDHDLASRRSAALDWCQANDLLTLGRFGHYDYFNSDQCVIAAREMAERLVTEAVRG